MPTSEAVADPREFEGIPEDVNFGRVVENWLDVWFFIPLVHVLAVLFAWTTFTPEALLLALVLLILTSLGVEMGFHRMLTHRAFETSRPVRYALVILGTLANQLGPVTWVANHRRHHKYSDDPDRDTHSPVRSFIYGHFTWIYRNHGMLKSQKYFRKWAPDLLQDPVIVWIDRLDHIITVSSIVILYLAGGWSYLIWGWCVRSAVGLEFEFSINSICHTFGKQPFNTGDRSRNNGWLAIPTLGESWHNNHHHAQRSARVGFEWWQIDPTWYLIWLMEKLGLVWNVVRPPVTGQGARQSVNPVHSEAEASRTGS